VDIHEVKQKLRKHFSTLFECELIETDNILARIN